MRLRVRLRAWDCKLIFITFLGTAMLLLLPARADDKPLPGGGKPVIGKEWRVKGGFIFNFARYTQWPRKAMRGKKELTLCIVSDRRDEDSDLIFLNGKNMGKKTLRVRICGSDGDGTPSRKTASDSDMLERLKSLSAELIPGLGKEDGHSESSEREEGGKRKHFPGSRRDRDGKGHGGGRRGHPEPPKGIEEKQTGKKSPFEYAEGCDVLFFDSDNRTFIREKLAMLKDRSVLTVGETEGFTEMGGIINLFRKGNSFRFTVNRCAAAGAGLKLSSQLLISADIKGDCK